MLPSVLQKGPEPHMLHSVTHTCKLFLSFFKILSRTQVHIEVAGLRLLFWDAADGCIWVKICALHCLIIVEEVALRARSALCFTGKPSVLFCHNNMESTQNWFVTLNYKSTNLLRSRLQPCALSHVASVGFGGIDETRRLYSVVSWVDNNLFNFRRELLTFKFTTHSHDCLLSALFWLQFSKADL